AFAVMGLAGFVVAGLVNLALADSTLLLWAVSVVGVAVFAALTAWDTQRLKREYLYGAMGGEAAERSAILGALTLYLDVINLFTLLVLVQVLGGGGEWRAAGRTPPPDLTGGRPRVRKKGRAPTLNPNPRR